jgi:hypothetical protein
VSDDLARWRETWKTRTSREANANRIRHKERNNPPEARLSLPLFVYGTLRDPDVLRLVIGHPVAAASAVPAAAPGHRVVCFPGRTYPAIRREPGATALGLALHGLSATDLRLLDLFEGDEYVRGEVEIIVSGERQTADVYWPALPIPAAAPDWRLGDWTHRHKAAFLAAEADAIAELRRHV